MEWLKPLADQGPLVVFAVAILVMLLRGVLHTDGEYQEMKTQRDRYRDLAWKGTHLADRGADVAEQIADFARQKIKEGGQ